MTDALMDQASEAKRTALGTLLIERGYIDQEQLDEALRRSAENGERLGEVIVKLGWASEDDLAKVLAEQWHLRYFERSAISFDGKALRRMSWEDASRLEALPIQENEEGAVVVAVAEPTDARLLALRELLGDRIDFVVVAKTRDRDGPSQRAPGTGRKQHRGRRPSRDRGVATDETVESGEPESDGSGQFTAYEAMATTSPFERAEPSSRPAPVVRRDDRRAGREQLRRGRTHAERRPELAARVAPVDRRRGRVEARHRSRARSSGSRPRSPSATRRSARCSRSCASSPTRSSATLY